MPHYLRVIHHAVDITILALITRFIFKTMKDYKHKPSHLTIQEAKKELYESIKEIPDVNGIAISGKENKQYLVVYFEKEPSIANAIKIPLTYHGYVVNTKVIGKIKAQL